jgi:hypothetical protein
MADTVKFFPYHCEILKTSSADAARHAAITLTHALQNPAPSTPFATIGDAQLRAIDQFAKIFATATDHQNPTTPTSPRVPKKPAPSPRVPNSPTPMPENANSIAVFPKAHAANSVTNPITGQVQEFRHLMMGPNRATWMHSFANEVGHLAQGVGNRMPSGTNTCFFISKSKVPHDQKVTYGRILASIRPQKKETNRTRLTVGGNRLDYPGATSTPTAKLTTAKCVLNSTISTPNGRFMVVDIKEFYLNTPLERYEYMRLPLSMIPDEIIQQYQLQQRVTTNSWVYIEIRKGMYGLKQAGILANQRLQKHLATHGYFPTPRTPHL